MRNSDVRGTDFVETTLYNLQRLHYIEEDTERRWIRKSPYIVAGEQTFHSFVLNEPAAWFA